MRYSEEDKQRIIKAVPRLPSDEIQEKVKSGMRMNMLIYKSAYLRDPLTDQRTQYALVKCISCGEEFFTDCISYSSKCAMGAHGDGIGFYEEASREYKTSYDSCVCQECGAVGIAMHTSRFNKYSHTQHVESEEFITYHNIEGCLAVLQWHMIKLADKEGRIYYDCKRKLGCVFVNKPELLKGCVPNYYHVSFWDNWKHVKKFDDCLGPCEVQGLHRFYDKSIILSTNCANSAFDVYLEQTSGRVYPFSYLSLYSRYKNLENLTRQGALNVVSDILSKYCIRGYTYSSRDFYYNSITSVKSIINWKSRSPSGMLGLNKQEFAFLKEFRLRSIDLYKSIKDKYSVRLSADELKLCPFSFDDIERVMNSEYLNGRITFIRYFNYLARQRARLKERLDITPGYYLDYIDYVVKIYGNVPESLLFPKDLRKAHNDFMNRVKEKVNKDINRKIKTRAKELEPYVFEDIEKGLVIIPCSSHSSLIKEGKALEHCVAKYATSIAEGKTSIFFIRRIDEPDYPYFTLEFKDNEVVQNRGYENSDPLPEVLAFQEEWLEELRKRKVI